MNWKRARELYKLGKERWLRECAERRSRKMGQRIVYTCDGCEREVGESDRVDLFHGRKMDEAGSMYDHTDTAHLCHKCCLAVLSAACGKSRRLGDVDTYAAWNLIKSQVKQ